jgi:hypothetical protein
MQNKNITEQDQYEVIKTCYDYFYRLIPGIQKIINGLYEQPEHYFKDLTDAFEGVSWLALAFIRTREMHKIDVDTVYIYDAQTAMIDALAAQDYGAVAEVLEHRTLPMIKEWFKTLDQDYGYEGSDLQKP